MSNYVIEGKLQSKIELKEDSIINVNIKKNASACLYFETSTNINKAKINVELEKNASCELFGFFKCNNSNMVLLTDVIHKGNESRCNQDFRFVNEKSNSKFEGKITIPKDVVKCESHMVNKNILLDDNSSAFSKPELDINNDDTICTHGCTIGALDEEHLYYLRTRGLTNTKATELLVKAFSHNKTRKFV